MIYELLIFAHLLGMLLVLGVGTGSAFYKYLADRSGSLETIVHVNRYVVMADWVFTTPSVVIQPLSGIALAHYLDLSLLTPWLIVSIVLYGISGVLWLGAVYLQIRMRDISVEALDLGQELPEQYGRYRAIWTWLGVPSFVCMFGVLVLMNFRYLLQ